METIVFLITLIGGIAGIYTILDYRKNHVQKPKDERQHLQIQFRATQNISRDVLERLIRYAELHAAYEITIPIIGVRTDTYILALEQSQNTNLSDELLERTLELPLNTFNIQSMVQSLETQFNALQAIQSWLIIQELND